MSLRLKKAVISASSTPLYIHRAELGKDQTPKHQTAAARDVGCLFYPKTFKNQSKNISAGGTGNLVRM